MYTLEQLPGEPIIIMTYKEPFDWQTEIPEASVTFIEMLEDQPEPVYSVYKTPTSGGGPINWFYRYIHFRRPQ